MIKVSVIIPVYNVEKYIEECLISVVNQSLSDIEIICVNDGTKDHSMDIIENYAKTDARIVIVEKENGGLSSARNAGISVAKGEFIYFLDSDDYIATDMLEILYNEAIKYDLDNIFFDAEAFYESKELETQFKHYKDYYRRPAMFEEIVSGPELFANMVNNRMFRPSACLQFPKRSLLSEHSISFYEGIVHEDNLFSLETIFAAKRTKHIATPFYKRRVREASIMTGGSEFKGAYGYYICISEFKRFLERFHFEDEDILRAIKYRFFVMQRNAINEFKKSNIEDIDKELKSYSLETQIEFSLFVKNAFELQQTQKNDYEKKLVQYKNKADKIQRSIQYRVGNGITYFPKKIYHVCKNISNKGILCTLYGLKRKLLHEKRALTTDKTCVSIIIPMYNAQKYLRECLEKLMRQSLCSIEIICVNDGSTDETANILKEYSNKDHRIKVINQKNQGAGIARNNGMKNALGEYLLFLDADDIFDEKLCEEAYYKAKYDMADIVLFGAYRYNVKTCEKEEMNWVLKKDLIPKKIPFSAKDTKNKIYQITTACPWSKMFKTSFVRKQNLDFQNTKNANDVYFVRRALALANRITVVNKRLITYRYNDGANIQSGKVKAPVEFYKAFKALKQDLIKRDAFKKVEQSYVNMVLTESLFNLRTAGNEEAKEQVKELLLTEGFDFFELDKYDTSYFYNKKDFLMYQDMLKK